MILVDSYGWIEYFTDGPLAKKYEKYLSPLSQVVSPTIILYEVYKKVKREQSEDDALIAISQIMKTNIVALDHKLSLMAAECSLRYSLPMADAIIYATALEKGCQVATSDPHFEKLDNVIYIK